MRFFKSFPLAWNSERLPIYLTFNNLQDLTLRIYPEISRNSSQDFDFWPSLKLLTTTFRRMDTTIQSNIRDYQSGTYIAKIIKINPGHFGGRATRLKILINQIVHEFIDFRLISGKCSEYKTFKDVNCLSVETGIIWV